MGGRDAGTANVIDSLLASVRRHTQVDVAWLSEYDGEGETIRALVGGDTIGLQVGARIPTEAAMCLASVTGRIPSVIADTAVDRRTQRLAGMTGDGVGAFAAAPVRRPDGTLLGAMCIASRAAVPHLGAPTEQFLRAVADVVADQWGHARAADEHRERERQEILGLLGDETMCTLLQPIVGLADGRTVGVEALTRFPTRPGRAPDLWFAMAAHQGLGADLEVAAVECALRMLDRIPAGWSLSINASPTVIESGRLTAALTSHAPHRIVVEVTEHVAVTDYVGLGAALDDLRALGIRIAVDDVGAGFASFRHVLQLRPDVLKVDRSLVRGLDRDPLRRAMVESVTRFAERAGARVVAEAVETPSELQVLQDLGVPLAQGYLFAAPGNPEDLRVAYPVRVPTGLDATG